MKSNDITQECWLWAGGEGVDGYGRWQQRGAHRVAYEAFVGEIPDGLWVLHRCDVRNCINPDHLFLGTHLDNIADMVAKGRHHRPSESRTHCKNGHEYTSENTRWEKRKHIRVCITCHNARTLASYHRRKVMA